MVDYCADQLSYGEVRTRQFMEVERVVTLKEDTDS